MNEHFPALIDVSSLPRRVLCLAPHADDEVLGCGGVLALHAARGDAVRIVVLTAASESARAEESRRAAAALGIGDVRCLGFEDGALAAQFDLVARTRAELADFAPELVYAPSPLELHPDHRAAGRACAAALARQPRCRVLLYGVNVPITAASGVLVDTTAVAERKLAALRCFASQLAANDLVAKSQACDRARTVNLDDARVTHAEGFVDLASDAVLDYVARAARLDAHAVQRNGSPDPWAATAVISTWNKVDDLRENLDALRAQTRAFESIVVVDNGSKDATARTVIEHYPDVRLIVMPHSQYGACETFNIGFASAQTPLLAILDDDVVLPANWLEQTVERLQREPATTALVSTEVVEPGMPASFLASESVRRERYMSTFRGCASLARTDAIKRAGGYDERLFIYGNERDLTCRLLNLGLRVLHYPDVRVFHKTPFGIKMGKRSLYYHARNAWLTQLKYAPASELAKLPWLVLSRVVLRGSKKEAEGQVSDATGTIGIGKSLRETPGAWWVVAKAGLNVLANLPYCLKHRAPVRASDFELPIR